MTWKYKNLTTLFSPLSSLSSTCESRFLNQSQAVPEMYFTCHLESSWYKLAKGAMTRIPVEICGDEPLIVPSIFGIRIPVSGFFVLLFTIASYCLLERVLAQSVHTLHSLLNFTKVSHYLKRVLVTPYTVRITTLSLTMSLQILNIRLLPGFSYSRCQKIHHVCGGCGFWS